MPVPEPPRSRLADETIDELEAWQDEARSLVRDDIEQGLDSFFASFSIDFERGGDLVGAGAVVGVAWEARGAPAREVRVRSAGGVDEVVIRGVTLVDRGVDPPTFARHVDWAEVYAQLGLPVASRPVATPREVERFLDDDDADDGGAGPYQASSSD